MANLENIIGGINNQITDEFGSDNDLEVTGGGRGWTATTTLDGEEISAKGSTKVGAAEALYEEVKRLAALAASDDLTSEDMTEAEFEQCVAECATSERDFCECKCNGDNHGILAGRTTPAVILGKKQCACGCGEITNRVYVPGHDAKHHARLALIAYARANGLDEADLEAVKKAKVAEQRKAARGRRAERKAAAEQVAAKAAKVAATEAKSTRSRKAAEPKSPKGDDLPF